MEREKTLDIISQTHELIDDIDDILSDYKQKNEQEIDKFELIKKIQAILNNYQEDDFFLEDEPLINKTDLILINAMADAYGRTR